MTTWPIPTPAFETSDGNLYRSLQIAEDHQRRIDGAIKATAMLEAGTSLGLALRSNDFISAASYPELDEVFASTKLVIPHWQCRDQPGYRPVRVTLDGEVFVHGHAGSWSGPYGARCRPKDVVRYWLDTKARAARGEVR